MTKWDKVLYKPKWGCRRRAGSVGHDVRGWVRCCGKEHCRSSPPGDADATPPSWAAHLHRRSSLKVPRWHRRRDPHFHLQIRPEKCRTNILKILCQKQSYTIRNCQDMNSITQNHLLEAYLSVKIRFNIIGVEIYIHASVCHFAKLIYFFLFLVSLCFDFGVKRKLGRFWQLNK